jgi:hypothetical protein
MRFTAVGFFASDCLSLVLNHTASQERSIMRANRLAEFGLFFGVAISIAGAAHAQSSLTSPQDPSVGGQANSCWGNVASQLAKIGMGEHSRSQTAADINGGFASNGLIQQPRNGVGNQSRTPDAPHQTQPGDGGNGVHATNNAILTDPSILGFAIDPVTGAFVTSQTVDPTHVLTPCEGVQNTLGATLP